MKPSEVRVTYIPNDLSIFPPQKVFLLNEDNARDFFMNCPSYYDFKVFVVDETKMTIKVVDCFVDALEFFRKSE